MAEDRQKKQINSIENFVSKVRPSLEAFERIKGGAPGEQLIRDRALGLTSGQFNLIKESFRGADNASLSFSAFEQPAQFLGVLDTFCYSRNSDPQKAVSGIIKGASRFIHSLELVAHNIYQALQLQQGMAATALTATIIPWEKAIEILHKEIIPPCRVALEKIRSDNPIESVAYTQYCHAIVERLPEETKGKYFGCSLANTLEGDQLVEAVAATGGVFLGDLDKRRYEAMPISLEQLRQAKSAQIQFP